MSGPLVDWASPVRTPKGGLEGYTVFLEPRDILAIENALNAFHGMSGLPLGSYLLCLAASRLVVSGVS